MTDEEEEEEAEGEADAEEAEAEATAGLGKCTRLLVPNVELSAKFRSSPLREGRYTAAIVSTRRDRPVN